MLEQPELFIPLLFVLFFVPFWCFVLLLLSLFSGWRTLAQHYRHELPFSGQMYNLQSARMRGVNFNGVLTFGVNERGLYVRPMILFRPFHPPLLIPWHELQSEPGRLLFFSGYRLWSIKEPHIKMFVYSRLFTRFLDYLGKR